MPTESQLFAETGPGLPDFYETLDRPPGDIDVHGHDEPLNYRYVGGEVFIRAQDQDAVLELLSGHGFDVSSISEPESMAALPPPPGPDESPDHGIPAGEASATDRDFGRVRLSLEEPRAVPDAVDSLIAANFKASPHHVYATGNHTQFGPADAPESISKPMWASNFVEQTAPTGSLAVIIDTGLLEKDNTDSFPFKHVLRNPHDREETRPTPVAGNVPPYVGHGTFVAGRLLQESPKSRIVMVRPENMWETADGESLAVKDDDLAMALLRALGRIGDSKAVVMNMSFSGSAHSGDSLTEFSNMRMMLDVWLAQGTVLVAAAGNKHSKNEHFPGAWKDVICVGATDSQGATTDYSNYGSWVDVEVLGDDTQSWHIKDRGGWRIEVPSAAVTTPRRRHYAAGPWHGYAKWSGTSFAAPYVAGKIASYG